MEQSTDAEAEELTSENDHSSTQPLFNDDLLESAFQAIRREDLALADRIIYISDRCFTGVDLMGSEEDEAGEGQGIKCGPGWSWDVKIKVKQPIPRRSDSLAND